MGQEGNIHMGLSVKAMIFHNGKMLLLQKNDPEGKHPWELPGGGLCRDEDFLAALRREVQEETGLAPHILAVAGTWCYQKKDGQFLNGVIFTALSQTEDVVLSSEHCAYRWVQPEEVGSYPLQESLRASFRQMRRYDYERQELLLQAVLAGVADE
ncbi:NUDIX domain-containing protein [uncultured Megasphaera sp.]|uniref:NUDIX domain-containing protein n=1 Tax=uncultured Megasphaera sp. TaxID=165188 RepID=UPI0025958380|nr:NUDIX hydrolase [uncultured Megasphaera sp.]